MAVFTTRKEVLERLGVPAWLWRKVREGGAIRPVVMEGDVRGRYYRSDEVAAVFKVEVDWQERWEGGKRRVNCEGGRVKGEGSVWNG